MTMAGLPWRPLIAKKVLAEALLCGRALQLPIGQREQIADRRIGAIHLEVRSIAYKFAGFRTVCCC